MPEYDDDFQDPEPEDELRNAEGSKALKAARAAAKRNEAEAAEARLLKRENAFLKAKIDVTTPLGQMALKAYEGPNDPGEISTWFSSLTAHLPTSTPQMVEGEPVSLSTLEPGEAVQTDVRRLIAANADTRVLEEPKVDLKKSSIDTANQALREGADFDTAVARMLSQRAAAAAEGDETVLAKTVEQREAMREAQGW